ncbi:MAG: sugar transferase [Gracilimonas sp.]|uniref:sugar transferase n=1 Tax=Gracilimonas sp. TaxID=1974203 RepID=UPI0019A78ABB|nr:sugar transferase [Gracilimonas sp.]MBD3614991.1 sugar transferase [Gracilimonas sp.]
MLKRFFDFTASITGLILVSPLFLLLMILVRIKMGIPVFFTQVRPGKNGKPFKMYKFRSMTNETDEEGNLLPNELRLLKFGKFLRSTSLDELPELINVIKGDMSLVGPRPLKMDYLKLYTQEQRRRHEVRPGVTGWAQVNGRNSISFTERFKMDVWYVDNQSLWLDIKILFRTLFKVFKRENINPDQGVQKKPFDGTN